MAPGQLLKRAVNIGNRDALRADWNWENESPEAHKRSSKLDT